MKPEKSIPDIILRQAKGLAIITVVKVGVMVTYNVGTGLVIARREDGSWSPPSAISTCGMGWGAQVKYSIYNELTSTFIVTSLLCVCLSSLKVEAKKKCLHLIY